MKRPGLGCDSVVKADGAPNGVEAMLASVRKKLPDLWDRAALALAAGQDHVASLALLRRRVLLHELDNLTQLVVSKAPHSRGALYLDLRAPLHLVDGGRVSRFLAPSQPQRRGDELLHAVSRRPLLGDDRDRDLSRPERGPQLSPLRDLG